METLRWPLDGEWVEGEEGKGGGGGGVIGCERENSAQCVLHPHMYMYICMVVSVMVKGRKCV